MKNRILIAFVILLNLIFLISLVLSQNPPTYHQFYGSILDKNNYLLNITGLEIKAYINGTLYSTTLTKNGLYGYLELFLIENGKSGDIINFYINGLFSKSYDFKEDESTLLDLNWSCGDNICNNGEDCAKCASDCGNCPPGDNIGGGGGGSSGGGGGSEIPARISKNCTENWVCSAWGNCSNGKETRNCFDKNKCNTTLTKPETTMDCSIEEIQKTGEKPLAKQSFSSNLLLTLFILFLIALIIITVVLITYIIYRKRRNKISEIKNELAQRNIS